METIKYKKVNLPWCPEIPKDWDVMKLSYDFSKIGSGTTPQAGNPIYYQDGEFNWLQTGDLNDGLITGTSKKITQKALDDYSTLRFYSIGSLVIAMYGATIGKIGILGIETTTNQACCVLADPKRFDIKFIYYWFHSNKQNIISLSYGGGQPNISQELIRNLRVQCPPLELQQNISKFLDQKTTELDNLISKKLKLIDCLKEERMAIINQAVTKGINPNAEMKDSGIEWLGDIPKHWEVKKLKYVLAEKNGIKIGPFGSSLKLETLSSEGIKIYGQGNIIQNDFEIGNRFLDEVRFENDFKQYLIEEGDVLVTMMGTTGKAKVFTRDLQRGIIDSHLIRLKLNWSSLSNQLLPILIENAKYIYAQMKINSRGSIMEGLNSTIIKDLKLCIAPIDEQNEIVNFIQTKTIDIDNTINKIEQEIELITEYKTSLINEVVTGKITLN